MDLVQRSKNLEQRSSTIAMKVDCDYETFKIRFGKLEKLNLPPIATAYIKNKSNIANIRNKLEVGPEYFASDEAYDFTKKMLGELNDYTRVFEEILIKEADILLKLIGKNKRNGCLTKENSSCGKSESYMCDKEFFDTAMKKVEEIHNKDNWFLFTYQDRDGEKISIPVADKQVLSYILVSDVAKKHCPDVKDLNNLINILTHSL